jgi:hypothetical protein
MWPRFRKLLYYVVLSFYVVSSATFVAVFWTAEWHQDLLRFSDRVWLAFLVHVGSTGPGFISPIILSVLSIVLTMACIAFLEGVTAMLKHWWETAVMTAVVLVTSIVLVYGPQFIWQLVRVAREDHRTVVASSQQLATDNKSLRNQLSDATHNAEQQCEQAKGDEIKQLKKRVNAACFNPDRRLGPMEQEQLFSALKRIRIEMEKQKQTPTFRFNGFSGDAETSRFAATLWPIFQNAGWTWKPIPPSPNAPDILKAKTEQAEQEKWMLDHGLSEGIMVFDKNWPKGFGPSVAMAFSQMGLADWFQSNQQQAKELPHLDELTVWIGYKNATR